MIYVRFANTGFVRCKHGVVLSLLKVIIPCCRVSDRELHPKCFGLSRVDSSTWIVEAGNYLELPEAVAIIQVPQDFDFFWSIDGRASRFRNLDSFSR